MISLPKKLKICGLLYNVELIDQFNDEPSVLGLSISYVNKIQIGKKYKGSSRSNDRICETLIHESFHIIECMLGTEISHNRLEKLSIGLYQVLLDNNLNLKPLINLPKKVKVAGYTYIVKYPYVFNTVGSYHYQINSTDDYIFKIAGTERGEKLNFEYIKRIFFELVIWAINATYCDITSDDYEVFTNQYLKSFALEIYNFIIDNNIEELVKKAAKAGDE